MSSHTLAHSHPPSSTTTDSARAVEVVASFGGGVVGVRHVADPKSGVVKAVTKALLAGGAALLATSAIAFGYASSVASDNAAAAKAWSDAGKPMWAFRPTTLPSAVDGLTLGGSMLGMAALVWGLSRRKSELQPSRIRLGTGSGVDFSADGVGSSFDLVAPSADGFAVNLVAGMEGELIQGGASRSLASLGTTAISMTADTRLRVKLGATTFHVASVLAAKKTATGALMFDRRPLAFVAASAIVHLGVVLFLRNAPSDLDTATGTDDNMELALTSGEIESRETRVELPVETGTGVDGDVTEQPSSMKLEAGKTGQEIANPTPGTRKIANDGPTAISNARAKAAAERAGILGSDAWASGDLFDSIMGEGDLTSQFDNLDVLGSQDGNGNGGGPGFGEGVDGNGPGGGGADWIMKAGPYDTIGNPGSRGDDVCLMGKCDGKKVTRTHTPTGPEDVVRVGAPTCKGDAGCDKSIIKRYIKRNAAKLGYCYESQLMVHPGLSGTVDATFTVQTDGTVLTSTASGMNKEVASCVANVIANIQFPKFDLPFQVRYPFFFHPAGS